MKGMKKCIGYGKPYKRGIKGIKCHIKREDICYKRMVKIVMDYSTIKSRTCDI